MINQTLSPEQNVLNSPDLLTFGISPESLQAIIGDDLMQEVAETTRNLDVQQFSSPEEFADFLLSDEVTFLGAGANAVGFLVKNSNQVLRVPINNLAGYEHMSKVLSAYGIDFHASEQYYNQGIKAWKEPYYTLSKIVAHNRVLGSNSMSGLQQYWLPVNTVATVSKNGQSLPVGYYLQYIDGTPAPESDVRVQALLAAGLIDKTSIKDNGVLITADGSLKVIDADYTEMWKKIAASDIAFPGL